MSDIDAVAVDSLKALDPKRPIREADIEQASPSASSIYDGVDAPRRHRSAKVEVLSTT